MKNIYITTTKWGNPYGLLGYNHTIQEFSKVTSKIMDTILPLIEDGDTVFITESQGIEQCIPFFLKAKRPNVNIKYQYFANMIQLPDTKMFSTQYFQTKVLEGVQTFRPDKGYEEYSKDSVRHRNNNYIKNADVVIAIHPSDMWRFVPNTAAIDMRVAQSLNKKLYQVDYMMMNRNKPDELTFTLKEV